MTKIDIFSGFLGAGKTTLIKKLIQEAYSGEKLVLIENEFGEIGIDGGFLQDAGVEITEMNSGCICCSLVGDFAEALKKVLAQFSPDRVLIEPSGVGKLSDVIRAVREIDSAEMQLNAFTTVVDAGKAKMYMKNFGEFFNDQVANAGAIVLSHTDKMSEEKLEAIFIDILYGTRCKNAGLQEVLNRLHELGLDFSREADAHKFVELYQKFHNSTRMQCNRGYTPDELFDMQPPEEHMPKALSFGPNIRKAIADGSMDATELRRSILSLELPSEELRMSLLKDLSVAESVRPKEPKKKVGRNDPCPCGSGKKYKKCCGR